MARVKRGVTTHARHQKVIKAAKGYYGARKNLFTVATQAVEKASQYSYRDRRNKKKKFQRPLDSKNKCRITYARS
jgi:large subunit ribosomal protein L20